MWRQLTLGAGVPSVCCSVPVSWEPVELLVHRNSVGDVALHPESERLDAVQHDGSLVLAGNLPFRAEITSVRIVSDIENE